MKVATRFVSFEIRGKPITASMSIPFTNNIELVKIYQDYFDDFIKNHLKFDNARLVVGVDDIAV